MQTIRRACSFSLSLWRPKQRGGKLLAWKKRGEGAVDAGIATSRNQLDYVVVLLQGGILIPVSRKASKECPRQISGWQCPLRRFDSDQQMRAIQDGATISVVHDANDSFNVFARRPRFCGASSLDQRLCCSAHPVVAEPIDDPQRKCVILQE